MVDAWNDASQRSIVKVFARQEDAVAALNRILERPGDWYAQVIMRKVR